MRRRLAAVTALTVGLSLGVPPEVVPADGGWPLSGLVSVLRQAPALATVTGLPAQEMGAAPGDEHYVSASETRADGGVGRTPGRGVGAVDPAVTEPEAPPAWTAPTQVGEDSFDEKTSKRLPEKSTAQYDEFRNADGSITRRISQGRINYRAGDGSFQPIETDLVRRGDRLEMGANSIDVTVGVSGTGGEVAAARSAQSRTPRVSPSAEVSPSVEASSAPAQSAPARTTPSAAAVSADSRLDSVDEALATVTTVAGHTVAYDLAGATDVAAVVDGSVATYPEILPGTDLELQTQNDGLKETIILKSPAAGNEWIFPLKLEGVTARAENDGSISLVASDGSLAMRMPAGYMEDSKVDPHSGAPAQSPDVTYELISVDGGPALKVTADEAWLNDPARQYPIRVDPSVYVPEDIDGFSDDTGDVFVDNDNSTANHNGDNLPVGTYNGGTSISRSFIHFSDFGREFSGKNIKGARLHLFHTWSYDCTSHEPIEVRRITEAWTVAGLENNGTLAKGPSYSGPIGTLTINDNRPACTNDERDRSVGAWRKVSLKPATFQGWASGATANHGLALTASESDSTAFKRFTSANHAGNNYMPFLEITYADNEMPQVNEQYPAYGQAVQTLTPELLADAHDPDNFPQSLDYKFIVYAKDGKTEIANSNWISKRSWKVPAGELVWGESYYWTVFAGDSQDDNAKYAIKHLLVTPVPQPLITAGLSQNGGPYGFDPVIGNYTTSARDAMINTVGPALEIVRSYNSIDPRTGQAFGAGWSSVVDAEVVEKATSSNGTTAVTSVVVTYPDGRDLAFGRNNNGTWSSPAGRTATLTGNNTSGYRLTEKDGTTYEFGKAQGAGKYTPVTR